MPRFQFRHTSGRTVSVTATSELEARDRAVTALAMRSDAGMGQTFDPAHLELLEPKASTLDGKPVYCSPSGA